MCQTKMQLAQDFVRHHLSIRRLGQKVPEMSKCFDGFDNFKTLRE